MAVLFDRETNPLAPDLDGLDLSQHNSAVGAITRLNAGFITTIAVVVLVRLYVRLMIVRRMGSDDIIMAVAGIFTVALCAMCIVGTRPGLGRHEWDLNPRTVIDQSKQIVQTLFVCYVLYATAVTMTKASIIASYLRVLPVAGFRRLMYVTAGVVFATWICSVFVTIFQCSPVRGAWDFELTDKKCIPILKFFYFSASVNILTDLVLCTSPLPLLWKLNVPLNERLLLCMLFAFGLFATVASAIRLSQLHNLGSIDFSYACVSSLNWSVVEVGTGIICASAPSLKPIIVHLFPGKIFTLQRASSRQSPRSDPPNQGIGNGLEMGSHTIPNTTFQKNDLSGKTAASTSISTLAQEEQISDEEFLVLQGPGLEHEEKRSQV